MQEGLAYSSHVRRITSFQKMLGGREGGLGAREAQGEQRGGTQGGGGKAGRG